MLVRVLFDELYTIEWNMLRYSREIITKTDGIVVIEIREKLIHLEMLAINDIRSFI